MSTRKPKSPYQKYQKSPKKYSPTYQLWRSAVLSGNSRQAQVHACAHAKQFGFYVKACQDIAA